MLRDKELLTTRSSRTRLKLSSDTPRDRFSTSEPPSRPSPTESLPLPPELRMPEPPTPTSRAELLTEVLSASRTPPFGSNSTKTCPQNSPLLVSSCIFWKTRELSSPDMDFDCDFSLSGIVIFHIT